MPNQSLDQELKRVHQSIAKIVRMLEDVVEEVSKREADKPDKEDDKPTLSRTSKINRSVLSTIEKSKKGITIQEIKAHTKLEQRQVNNALYKLTKKGFVKAKTRGVYIIEESRYRA